MRLTAFLIIISTLSISAKSYSQKVNLSLRNAPIEKAFRQIREQTGRSFLWTKQTLQGLPPVSISIHDASLDEAIKASLDGLPLTYGIRGNVVYIERKRPADDESRPTAKPRLLPASKVTGKVTDSTGIPLVGVTIKAKSGGTGAVTDGNGNYAIRVEDDAILIVSYVGYQTKEVPVNGRDKIDIVLSASVSELNQLVVVGYGTQKKSDLTGSLSQVKPDDINAFPTTNVLQSLAGRAPGVQVFQSTGAPGAGMSVRIRGRNSIQGGNEPLYVVDGFPVSGNPTFLNKSDIKSMEILKDASATAIYGSRGANGVVLITTRDGSPGRTKITFDASYSSQKLRKKLDLMNGEEYAELVNLQAINDGDDPFFTDSEIQAFGKGFDWQDLIFQEAPMKSSNLNISGGNNKTRFAISGSILDQDGIIAGSNYKRYSLYSKFQHTISRKFSVNVSTILTRLATARKDSKGGARGGSMISAAISAAPISRPYNDDGSYNQLANEYPFVGPDIVNPMFFIKEQSTETKANIVLSNAALTYKPIPELSLKLLGGIENRDDRTDTYTTRQFKNSDGRANVSTGQSTSLLSEFTANYDKTFGMHHISGVAGFTYQSFLNTSLGGSGVGFLSDVFETDDLGAAETPGFPGSGYSKSVLLSYLGRINYAFNSKYLVTASFRSDGSSRYSDGNKWGYFPSFALAWHASEEPFFKNGTVISDLKIRTSWGLTGSQAISPYSTLNRLDAGKTVFGNELYSTFSPGTRLPGDLKWETTEQIDAGLDIGLIRNRLYLTADYYIKNTRDLLNTVRLPSSMGFVTTIRNVGEVQNRGIELGIDAVVFNQAFKWDVYTNISFNRNKVVKLYDNMDILTSYLGIIIIQDNISIMREGRPLGQFLGYVEDGYDDNGHIKYKDLDGDGTITSEDKKYIGNPNPDFIYGFNSTMSYKNFQLTLFIDGTYGNDIFNASSVQSTLDYGRGLNMPREVLLDHWTPDHRNAKYPTISINSGVRVSDRFIENGSYLRLRNIQIAYNFPMKKTGINWITNAQLYLSGQNLITLTNYSWWDPAMGSDGLDYYQYPRSKVITAGIKLGF